MPVIMDGSYWVCHSRPDSEIARYSGGTPQKQTSKNPVSARHIRVSRTRATTNKKRTWPRVRAAASPPTVPAAAGHGSSVLGYWVGVRRPFHLSLFLTASRVALSQDPSTDPKCATTAELVHELQPHVVVPAGFAGLALSYDAQHEGGLVSRQTHTKNMKEHTFL